MNTKILLTDLAAAAGCSVAQASRAINGKPNVAPEIRARVLAAARQLNYRNTAMRHIPNIAIIKHGSIRLYSGEVIGAIEACLHALKWGWQIFDIANTENINEFFYDGIISVSSAKGIAQNVPRLMNFPLVVINDYGLAMENICSIDPDTFEESRLVLEHLTGLGHKKILRIKHVSGSNSPYLLRGDKEYFAAAKLYNVELSVGNIIYYDGESLEKIVRTAIDDGYTAIFMIHQYFAVAISSVLQKLKVQIPQEISLVTYEVPEVTKFLYPPHTTIAFEYPELARIAVEQLKRRMKGESTAIKFNSPVKLLIRDSTGPAPGR